MQKLILKYHWATEYVAEGFEVIPVEYKSKIALQCHILDLIKSTKDYSKISILGHKVVGIWTKKDLEYFESQIDHMVFTLEEWFEKNKIK